MNIEKYTPQYRNLTKNYSCGNMIIDILLRSGDAPDENQGITYILLSDKKDFIIGYYNVEVGRIDQVERLGDSVIYKPMGGTVNINYLAIHNKFQGTKLAEIDWQKIYLGDYLLRHCEKLILKFMKTDFKGCGSSLSKTPIITNMQISNS